MHGDQLFDGLEVRYNTYLRYIKGFAIQVCCAASPGPAMGVYGQ